MSNIVTFYSYKGGVGRSMALANVATVLSLWGFKTLVIDFDFEAPGLQYFFKEQIKDFDKIGNKKGILNLLNRDNLMEKIDWQELVIPLNLNSLLPSNDYIGISLDLIISGNKGEKEYIEELKKFNASDFYQNRNGSIVIERLREEWKLAYDFILIDSRTGVTDIGGICTIQMPDILVTLFTATEQGWIGTKDVIEKAVKNHNNLPFVRERLKILPIPTRIDGSEKEKTDEWLELFSKELTPVVGTWMHKEVSMLDFIKNVYIPYIPYYSFGEHLAVIDDIRNPKGIGYSMLNISSLLSKNLQNSFLFLNSRDEYIKSSEKDGYTSLIERVPSIEKMDISNLNINNLNFLSKYINLTQIDLSNNSISDLSVLSNLTNRVVAT
jgi:cellulose biosynthesis protein BcsQ